MQKGQSIWKDKEKKTVETCKETQEIRLKYKKICVMKQEEMTSEK